jgi:hypothetical protein
MTGEDVEALSARLSVPGLRAYVRAVTELTRAVIGTLAPDAGGRSSRRSGSDGW